MPLAIPEQPEDNWFDALADTLAVASPLETLAWLHAPDSSSLGKRTFHVKTGLNTLRYGLAEYEACDDCYDSLEEYWQPEEECHDMDWSNGNA